MRKVEFSLIAAVALSIIVLSFHVPGGGILLTVTTLALAFFYAYLSTAYFNNISIRRALKKGALDKVSTKHKILATYSGVAIAFALVSVLFQAMHWPSANVLTVLGILVLLPAIFVCIYKIAKGSKNIAYRKSVQRTASYLFVTVCAYIYF